MSEIKNGLVPKLEAKNAALEARVAELEAASQQMQEVMGLYAALPKDDTALSMLVPVLSKMAEFGANRQFHKITLGMLTEWTETALKITQRAKLAALVAEEPPAAAPVYAPCKTCKDKVIIWQWGIDAGHAHVCPDCADDWSIEQLEAKKWDKPKNKLTEAEQVTNAMLDKLIRERKAEIVPDNAPAPAFKIGDMVTIPGNVIPPFVMPITQIKWYGDSWLYELDGRSFWAENTIEAAPVADAPVQEAPRFKVGDKVRIKQVEYIHGMYDEIETFDGEIYTLKDVPINWRESELEAYSSESEGE